MARSTVVTRWSPRASNVSASGATSTTTLTLRLAPGRATACTLNGKPADATGSRIISASGPWAAPFGSGFRLALSSAST
jgi:hypothetical protein